MSNLYFLKNFATSSTHRATIKNVQGRQQSLFRFGIPANYSGEIALAAANFPLRPCSSISNPYVNNKDMEEDEFDLK